MKGVTGVTWGRRFTIALVLALTGALSIAVGSAFADAGNPIQNTIKATATDNGSTVTISVRGQWNWISHTSDCNFDRAATGVGIAWQDLNGPAGTTTRGNNEKQRVALTGTVTGGTFKLKFGGQTTGTIAWNATNTTVQSALTALTSIGAGNVTVTGGPGPSTPWDIEFTGGLGLSDQPAIQVANKSLTGSGTNVVATTLTAGSFPVYNGYLVDNGPIRAYIGTSTATLAPAANPADRMVHPVDRGNVPEGYTSGTYRNTGDGYATNTAGDYPFGQAFVDPAPTATPGAAQVAAWKGGCGREALTDIASKGSHAEKTGRNCGTNPGSNICSGHPWGSWGYEKTYSHTYLKELPSNVAGGGSGLPDRICVNFYDVHGGGDFGSGFQVVNSAKEITVDLAGDNSIDTNAFNVNDGANCISLVRPAITTTATNGSVGGNIHDTAHLSGIPAGTGGTITFDAYGPDDSDCSDAAAFHSVVQVNAGNGDYSSGDFLVTEAGSYNWTAVFVSSDSLVLGATSACGAENETSTVSPKSPALSTDAGDTLTLEPCPTAGDPDLLCADLRDMATLTLGFNPTGTISYELYSDASCTTLVDTVGIDANNPPNAPPADGFVHGNGTYTSEAITVHAAGTYHWIANYSGDNNNEDTENECNQIDTGQTVTHENVRVVNPGIMITKTACRTGGTLDFPFTGEECAADGDTLTIHSGDTVTYHFLIANTGDDDLTDVTLDDDTLTTCDSATVDGAAATVSFPYTIGNLAAGDDIEVTCTVTVSGDVTNTATAEGTEPDSGGTVDDEDDADVDVIAPDIDITKTVCRTGGTPDFPFTGETCALDGDTLTVHSGDTITYHFVVENTGDVDLTDVTLDDDTLTSCDSATVDGAAAAVSFPYTIGNLASGDDIEVTCTVTIGDDDVSNTATATGEDEIGGSVDEDDTADTDVIHPDIDVTKVLSSGQTSTPLVGTDVSFDITVTNTGDVPLTDIAVEDTVASDCERDPLFDTLDGRDAGGSTVLTLAKSGDAGDSFTYTCTLEDVQIDVESNTAEACADDELDGEVCDDDTEEFNPQPRTPPVNTEASASIVVGNGTIHDTATLGICDDGGNPATPTPDAATCGYNPTGTITFELYGPDDADCTGLNLVDGDPTYTVTVNGNGPYDSPNFTPTTAGTYRWIANYSGDDNNDATANLCNGENEDVIVQPADSSVTTEQNLLPNDKATVTGASVQPTGDVTFELFSDSDCNAQSLEYSQTVTLTPGLGLDTSAFTTNDGDANTGGFTAEGNGTWYWKVTYPGDDNNNASESACGEEIFTIDNDTTP